MNFLPRPKKNLPGDLGSLYMCIVHVLYNKPYSLISILSNVAINKNRPTKRMMKRTILAIKQNKVS